MSVTENEAARQVNSANLRQWQAVLGADEWQRAWEAMAEPDPEGDRAVREYLAAQARADDWAAYCALRAEEEAAEKRVRCDTCAEECLLEEATICPLSDVVTCPRCLETETLAGEEVLGGVLR
jgi:hypothetical protein